MENVFCYCWSDCLRQGRNQKVISGVLFLPSLHFLTFPPFLFFPFVPFFSPQNCPVARGLAGGTLYPSENAFMVYLEPMEMFYFCCKKSLKIEENVYSRLKSA